jgi:hypothetical protein
MTQYKLKAGLHIEDNITHKEGSVFVSARDLCNLFPGKFEDLGTVPSRPIIVKAFVPPPAPVIPVSVVHPEPVSVPVESKTTPKRGKPAKVVVEKKDDWDDETVPVG